MNIESSNQGTAIPPKLYESIKFSLERAFRCNPCIITEQFDFYDKLAPLMQNDLI